MDNVHLSGCVDSVLASVLALLMSLRIVVSFILVVLVIIQFPNILPFEACTSRSGSRSSERRSTMALLPMACTSR